MCPCTNEEGKKFVRMHNHRTIWQWKENLSFTHVIVGFVQLEVYLPNGKNGHNFLANC